MDSFTTNIQLVYVLAAACFVVGLHLMNSPATARRGNQVSIAGMAIAVIATLVLLIHELLLGGARREPTRDRLLGTTGWCSGRG